MELYKEQECIKCQDNGCFNYGIDTHPIGYCFGYETENEEIEEEGGSEAQWK